MTDKRPPTSQGTVTGRFSHLRWTRNSYCLSFSWCRCCQECTEGCDGQVPVRPKCRSPRRQPNEEVRRVYFTPSCTGWTLLSGSSTSSEWLFTSACSVRLHYIWSAVACCPLTSPVVNMFALPTAVSSTCHDITGASLVVGFSLSQAPSSGSRYQLTSMTRRWVLISLSWLWRLFTVYQWY